MKILVVDDSVLVRQRLVNMITALPQVEAIHQVDNPSDALESCRLLHPDVVMLDIHMPCCDDTGITKEIRDSVPGARIMMLSDSLHPYYQRKSIEMGADYFFHKASEFEDLLSCLKRYAASEEIRKGGPS